MTWRTGVPEERRTEFAAELQRRLDADQVPYRVGRTRSRTGLVFRCQVKGRDPCARQARAAAFDHCSIHQELLRLEMFEAQPYSPAIREVLAFLAALLLLRRSSSMARGTDASPGSGEPLDPTLKDPCRVQDLPADRTQAIE